MNAVEFVESTVSALAKSPAKVDVIVDDAPGWQGVVINVQVSGDVPTVIGKQGKTIEAVRVIAKALGWEDSHRVKVNVNESDKPRD